MKLQQTFGHDIRFKMDERFLESDEELDFDPKNNLNQQTKKRPFSEVGEGDEIDKQLQEEKLLSFKVLQEVLGRNSVFVEETDDYRNHYRYVNALVGNFFFFYSVQNGNHVMNAGYSLKQKRFAITFGISPLP